MGRINKLLHSGLRWRLAVLAVYPLLAYISMVFQQPALRTLCIPLLAIALFGFFPSNRARAMLLLVAVALTLLAMLRPALALWPPGIIFLGLSIWFGASLRPGHTPMIERIALVVHSVDGSQPPDGAGPWLRGWTVAWAGLLAAIGLVALALAALDRTPAWLLWVLLIAPLVMFTTLGLELFLRRRRFPGEPHPSLKRFLLDLARIRPEHLA